MSAPMIKVSRPTKIELLRLKRRLALARRYHGLLKDRETYLAQVFRETLKELVEARRELSALLASLHESYGEALAALGHGAVAQYAALRGGGLRFSVGYRNVMGVWVLSMEPAGVPRPDPRLPLELLPLQASAERLAALAARVAEGERALVNLGQEIARLRRVVNMLEKVYIPRLERTIKYLSMKFDELSREESIRAIRVKKMLESR